jgi:hypothetical protein
VLPLDFSALSFGESLDVPDVPDVKKTAEAGCDGW